MPRTPLAIALARPWPGTLRGLILWLFGIAFIVVGGLNYLGTTIPEPTRTYLAFALQHIPANVIGCGFVSVGAFAMTTAYCHVGRDHYGYLVAAVLSGGWGCVYVCGWLFYDAPARALGGAVVWILYCAILMTCAQIPKITFGFATRAGA